MGTQSNIWSRYWNRYGGWASLWKSLFFQASVLLCVMVTPLWWQGGIPPIALSVLPSLLGFSIASFTMLLAVGDEDFRKYLSVKENADGVPRLLVPATSFFHFVIFQIIALALSLLASARTGEFLIGVFHVDLNFNSNAYLILYTVSKCLRGLTALAFIYAVLSGIAAMMNIYRLTEIYVVYSKARARHQRERVGNEQPPADTEGPVAKS